MAFFALGHTTTSIPSYLSALQNLYDSQGAGPLPRGPSFLLAMRGLRRIFAAADTVVQTRAINMDDLRALLESLDTSDPDDVCFGAQLIVAFMLCLRTEDHTAGRLCWGDVYPQEDGGVDFQIPPGKSCPDFRHVAIAARDDIFDALTWLRRLAMFVPIHHRCNSSPLFVSFSLSKAGTPRYLAVSRQQFISRFKSKVATVLSFDPALYAGYSLRSGGVTQFLSADVPLPVVKQHVRWAPQSNAVFSYYDHSGRAQLLQPTRKLFVSL